MTAHRYAKEYDTPEKRRTYDRERKQEYREIRGMGLRGKSFVGVDGEGGNDKDGNHQYYLLTAGGYRICNPQPADGSRRKPLTGAQCLAFLADLPPNFYYVGYFFDYDVTMILRDLPPDRITRLLNREARTRTVPGSDREYTYPVDWGGFQFDYLPHKEFKVRRRTHRLDVNGRPTYTKWVTVNDVGSFFQCAFIKALTLWEVGTQEQRDDIATGKDMRADFGELTEDIITYNALEITLLQILMEDFRGVCEDIGYVPARWQGPGNLATAMLRHHGVPKTKDLHLPDELIESAGAAYYGGRFETTAVGTCVGPIYAYDINSAYPDALTRLPCLLHGLWDEWDGRTVFAPLPGTLYLAHGEYTPKDKTRPGLYGFPHRTKQGGIFYPSQGSGWYWSCEIEAAAHQNFTPDKIFVYHETCDCAPFEWVPDVYAQRIALGKTTKGGVLKLGLNSIYGKIAQSVGVAPYANPIWAGLITALTRAKLSSIAHYPNEMGDGCLCKWVYMLATDAVFTDQRLHVFKSGKHKGIEGKRVIKPSKELGGWDLETHDQLHIIQPGLYFTSAATPPKTRGVPRQLVVEREAEFRAVYDDLAHGRIAMKDAKVIIPLKQFIGLKVAYHRNRPDLAGQWIWCGEDGKGKAVSYAWGNKRNLNANIWERGIVPTIITEPYHMDAGESTPYSKDIGAMYEAIRLDAGFDMQPDWAPNLKDEDM